MAKYNVHGVKVGDRVRLTRGPEQGQEITITKVVNRITHYVEGNDDAGGFYNMPLHWCEPVKPKPEG